MNRRALFAFVLLLIPCRGEEEKPDLTFVTRVKELPACDRVEVIRLDRPCSSSEKERPAEEGKPDYYELKPFRDRCRVIGTVMVKGGEAERLAKFFRSFQERVFPKGSGRSICHLPPYAYRFHAGDKLVGEASVCWLCRNILIEPGDKGRLVYFKDATGQVKELLDASNQLFPGNPAK